MNHYGPKIEALFQIVIGSTKVVLDGSTCRFAECNIGNMITDAFVHARVVQYNGSFWSDAPLAILQGGGIRSSADVGNITKFDLETIMPFTEDLQIVNVTGKILKDALEFSVEKYAKDHGEFLQMSGIRVSYNMQNPISQRVVFVEVKCIDCKIPQYEKLDMDKEYRVIMSSFVFSGGDGFEMFKVNVNQYFLLPILCSLFSIKFLLFFFSIFKDLYHENMKITSQNAVEEYMKSVGVLYPIIDGRITILTKSTNDTSDNAGSGADLLKINLLIYLVAFIVTTNFFK